jgi:hypothetical protein
MRAGHHKRSEAPDEGMNAAADRLLDAIFTVRTYAFEREQLSRGTGAEIKERLTALTVRTPLGEYPECYRRFNRLMGALDLAEAKFSDSALARKLFGEARWLFRSRGFDVHHLEGFGDEQVAPVRRYVDALMIYAPKELERSIPLIVKQFCTDVNFLAAQGSALEALIAKVPEPQRERFAAGIVDRLIEEGNYVQCFIPARMDLGLMHYPEKAAEVRTRLQRAAAFIKEHGTPAQQTRLIRQACERAIERDLVPRIKEALRQIFPEQ